MQGSGSCGVFPYVIRSDAKPSRAFYRTLNERLLDEHAATRDEEEVSAYFCECGDAACASWVRLSGVELQDWLGEPGSSILAPGHEREDDDVVVRSERYVVVYGV